MWFPAGQLSSLKCRNASLHEIDLRTGREKICPCQNVGYILFNKGNWSMSIVKRLEQWAIVRPQGMCQSFSVLVERSFSSALPFCYNTNYIRFKPHATGYSSRLRVNMTVVWNGLRVLPRPRCEGAARVATFQKGPPWTRLPWGGAPTSVVSFTLYQCFCEGVIKKVQYIYVSWQKYFFQFGFDFDSFVA